MTINEELKVDAFPSPYLQAVLNILFTGHWLTTGINRALKDLGLSEPQFNVLSILFAHLGQPIGVSEIQERMIQRESNITRIVDKLLRRQWVVREVCPENRRRVNLFITKSGRETFKTASAAVMAFHEPLMRRLSPEESQKISILLDGLRGKGKEKETPSPL